MAEEIERKFLVHGDGFKAASVARLHMTQGYLSSVPERVVRIRIEDQKGFITIKGISNASGVSRYEWEQEIPLDEARELLELCEPGIIEKTRYQVPIGSHRFEVDEFYGDNLGLVIAEIELKSEGESFQKPAWLAQEVTGDPKYFNAMLKKNPYKNWP